MRKLHLLSGLVCILLVTSCDPTDSNDNGGSVTDGQFAENFGAAVSRDFIGQVVDMDNHAVQNAAVTIGSSTVQTDSNGVFILNNASVHEKFAYITAKKSGYIDGSRALVPTQGKNNIKIMLIPATPVETIVSGSASEVALPSGTKVVFDGAFQDENGNDYTGNVSVAMFHLETSNENLASLMPGMLYAKGEDGGQKVLGTFGMLNVELRGGAGQKLNIKQGHTAQITMKIDDSQLATAPASIPLWHFDEDGGYWKQDGEATKQGNNYVGNVSHFSWWNCDTFSNTVNLTIKVTDSGEHPLSDYGVKLVVTAMNFNSCIQYTDNLGLVSGDIPANQILQLHLYNTCGDEISNTMIGPFAANTVLPPIVVPFGGLDSTQITGNLTTCDNSNVANGYVLLHYGIHQILCSVTDGAFSFSTLPCNTTPDFTLEGYDYTNQQTTGIINYTFNDPVTNIGDLPACTAVTEFISYKIDNNPTVSFLANVNAQWNVEGWFSIGGYGQGQNSINIFGFGNVTAGNYTSDEFELTSPGLNLPLHSQSSNVIYHMNNVGAVGQYVDMTFDGTYNDTVNNVITQRSVAGIVHALRSQ